MLFCKLRSDILRKTEWRNIKWLLDRQHAGITEWTQPCSPPFLPLLPAIIQNCWRAIRYRGRPLPFGSAQSPAHLIGAPTLTNPPTLAHTLSFSRPLALTRIKGERKRNAAAAAVECGKKTKKKKVIFLPLLRNISAKGI